MKNNRRIVSFYDKNLKRISGVIYKFDNRLTDNHAIQSSAKICKTNPVLRGHRMIAARVEVYDSKKSCFTATTDYLAVKAF